MNHARDAILEVLKKSKLVLLLILLFNLASTLVSTLQPVLVKDLFDALLPRKEIDTAISYILLIVLLPVVFAALNSITAYFDYIVVVDNGKIAEKGSPDELLSMNGIFRSMYEKQKI